MPSNFNTLALELNTSSRSSVVLVLINILLFGYHWVTEFSSLRSRKAYSLSTYCLVFRCCKNKTKIFEALDMSYSSQNSRVSRKKIKNREKFFVLVLSLLFYSLQELLQAMKAPRNSCKVLKNRICMLCIKHVFKNVYTLLDSKVEILFTSITIIAALTDAP